MNIEINHDDIAAAIQASATKAISDQMGGYKVREAIVAVITEDLAQGLMADSIRKAIAGVDTEALTTAIARELQRSMVIAATRILQDSAVEMIAKMRGIESYDSEREKKIAALRVEMFEHRRNE